MNKMPSVFWTTDTDLRITSMTNAGVDDLKLQLEQATGRDLTDYFGTHNPGVTPVAEHHRALQGESLTCEFEWMGHILEAYVAPLRQHDGTINGVVGAAMDITSCRQIEQTLRRSEEQIRLITDSIPDLISYIDTDQRYVFNNKAYEAWFDMPREEIQGRHIREILGESLYKMAQKHIETVLSGQKVSFESTGAIRSRADERRHVIVNYIPHIDEQDKVLGFFISVNDITEMRRAETVLLQASLLEQTHDAVVSADMKGMIQTWNAAAERTYGYAASEVIGEYVGLLHYPEDLHDMERNLMAPLIEQGHHETVIRLRRKDGTPCYVDLRMTLLHDDTGAPVGMIACSNDITERKKIEEMLRQKQDRERQYLDIAGVMLIALDSTGVITLINRMGCQILGYEEHELLGCNWFDTCIPDHMRNFVRAVFRRLMEKGINLVEYYDSPVITRSNEERQIIWHNAILTDESGDRTGVLSSGQDITGRWQAAQELGRAHRELTASHASLQAEIQQRQGVLQRLANAQEDERRRIAIDLHDRTAQTLAALLLRFKVLEDSGLPSSAQDHIAQLKDLTHVLMDEMHFLAWELHPPNMDEWGLSSALEHYIAGWSQQQGIQADFHSSDVDQRRFLQHIETTIYRIIQELLSNVLNHANASQVSVLIQYAGRQLETIVEDNGRGFDPESVLNLSITDPHQRLGLLGIQERVNMVDGELKIESISGGGTTVFIRIPADIVETQEDPP